MIPFYLNSHLADIKEKKNKTTGILVSTAGNKDLEIYYYGELALIRRTPYICDGEYPCLIVAKDSLTAEEFVVFDGLKHGYDAMFCNEPIERAERNLQLYHFQKGKIAISFGYSIDYGEEKEDYTFNENNEIELIDGTYLDFEKAKSIGYDWLSMKFLKNKKEFVDLELA